MKIKLIRIESSEQGVFGCLLIENEAFCVTLEPSFKENFSCIPEGVYACEFHVSPKFGETFIVKNVRGRSDILFHPGNREVDTLGCILIGQYFGKLKGDRAILNSGNTFKNFMKRLEGVDYFALEIVETF